MKDNLVIDNLPYKRGYKIIKKEIHEKEKRNIFMGLGVQLNSYLEKSHLVSTALPCCKTGKMIRIQSFEANAPPLKLIAFLIKKQKHIKNETT